jgi:hypothetical protein
MFASLEEELQNRLRAELGPHHAVSAASLIGLITLDELKVLATRRFSNHRKVHAIMLAIAHRWETHYFLRNCYGFRKMFVQAMLRIRWVLFPSVLDYNVRKYVRVMQWRVLVGVANVLLSNMLHAKDSLGVIKNLSTETRQGLKLLRRRMLLIGRDHALQLPTITELIRKKIKMLLQKDADIPQQMMFTHVRPWGEPGLHLSSPSMQLDSFLSMFPCILLSLPLSKHCCHGCGRQSDANLRICSGCKFARYCSQACQKEHWKAGAHSDSCQTLAKRSPWLNELHNTLDAQAGTTWGEMLARNYIQNHTQGNSSTSR